MLVFLQALPVVIYLIIKITTLKALSAICRKLALCIRSLENKYKNSITGMTLKDKRRFNRLGF